MESCSLPKLTLHHSEMLPAVSFRIFLPPRFKQTLFSHWSPSNTALPFGARHVSPGTFELHQCMDVLLRLKRLLLAYLVPLLGTQSLNWRKYWLTDVGRHFHEPTPCQAPGLHQSGQATSRRASSEDDPPPTTLQSSGLPAVCHFHH